MTTYNPNVPGHFPLHADKVPGLFFRKRVEKVDWKRLASVDVRRVASQMDIDALQDNLISVAFCDIDSEIDIRYADANLIKLFKLAQLLIEYLLYSQDFLKNTVDNLRLENENVKKETAILKRRLDEQTQRLTSTRKECHRRRLLLLAQQRLMNNGPQSYFRCPHCPKAFISASFLNAHLYRRHVEIITALQNVDLNRSGVLFQSLESANSHDKEKTQVDQRKAILSTNLELQIKEVLDHIKAQHQPPTLPVAPPISSAIIQTTDSPDTKWKKRATELERQLEEEKDHLRQLEERNRVWQDAITSQYKVDVERVREMFEAELRNLREENLETQKELIQLRIKRANIAGYGNPEDDVPEQLERQVKSLEQKKIIHREPKASTPTSHVTSKSSPETADTPLSTLTLSSPQIKMVNNANKAVDGTSTASSSWHQISRSTDCFDEMCSMSPASPTTVCMQSRFQQTSLRGENVSIQVALCENTSQQWPVEKERPLSAVDQKTVVDGLITRTEDEGSERSSRSIYLIPVVFPALSIEVSPKKGRYQPYPEHRLVQVADGSSYVSCNDKEHRSRSRSPRKMKKVEPKTAERWLQNGDSERHVDPLMTILSYKDQLKECQADPDAMMRFRKEVNFLLEERLIDHDVELDAKGLTRGKFNEITDILGLERHHLSRKYPNFDEIRASLSRKVGHMALQTLHSKREHASSSPSRGESSSLKRARTSRMSERGTAGRPPSGRPSSLTSLATTLSPIAEHRRGATVSPVALRRPATNYAHSKQSLFEDSGDEDEDADEDNENSNYMKGERKGGEIHRAIKMPSKTLSNDEDSEDDLGAGLEWMHGKTISPGPSVKFSDENLHERSDDPDEVEDYRFVRRKLDEDEDNDEDDADNDDKDNQDAKKDK